MEFDYLQAFIDAADAALRWRLVSNFLRSQRGMHS